MGAFIQKFRTEVAVFSCAFGIRTLYALVIQAKAGGHGFVAFSDAYYFYYQAALNIAQHGAFSLATAAPFFPDAYHTPLYPLFLAPFLFFHVPLFAVVTVQHILASLTVVLTYKIAIRLTSSRGIAIFAATLAVLEPMSIYWSALLMSDTFFAFLMALAFYLLLQGRYSVSMFVLGLAALTRPIALYCAPFFFLMILYQQLSIARERNGNVWRRTAAAAAIFFATIVPWSIHNKLVFNTWSFSSAGWYELYISPLPVFAAQEGVSVPVPAYAPATPDFQFVRFNFEYVPFYRATFLSIISKDPFGYGIFHLERSFSALVSNRYSYLVYSVLQPEAPALFARVPPALVGGVLMAGEAFWLLIYLCAFLGLTEKALWPWWLFFGALLGVNLLLAGAINPSGTDMSRYSMFLYPFFFLFAGVGIRAVWRAWGGRG